MNLTSNDRPETGACCKPRWITVTVLLGTLVVGLVFNRVWTHERKYEGKPISQWVRERFNALNSEDLNQRKNEETRFASLGSAIVPDLISLLEIKGSLSVEDRMARRLLQLPATKRIAIWLDQRVLEAQNTRMEASFLLGELGPQAEPAVPAMVRIYQATNQPDWVRSGLLDSFRQINRRPDLVVPICIASLTNVDRFTPQAAAWTLGAFGTNSMEAIPALRDALHHPHLLVGLIAAQAIHRIDARAWDESGDQVMPLLVMALENRDKANRLLAISLVAQYETRAQTAAPLLVKIRQERDPSLSAAVAEALKKILPEADAKAVAK